MTRTLEAWTVAPEGSQKGSLAAVLAEADSDIRVTRSMSFDWAAVAELRRAAQSDSPPDIVAAGFLQDVSRREGAISAMRAAVPGALFVLWTGEEGRRWAAEWYGTDIVLPVVGETAAEVLPTILEALKRFEREGVPAGVEQGPEPEQAFEVFAQDPYDGVAVFEYDATVPRRRLLYCNDRYVEMSGRTRAELKRTTDFEGLEEKLEWNYGGVSFYGCLATRRPMTGVSSWRRPDERENYFWWVAIPWHRDGMQYIMVLNRDVTKQRLREQHLEETEEHLRRMMDLAYDGVSITRCDPESGNRELLYCNDRYVEMSGRPREELRQAADVDRFIKRHTGDSDPARCIREGRHYTGTASWKRPDGRDNEFEYTAVPMHRGGDHYVVSILRDVTARRTARKTLQRAGIKPREALSYYEPHIYVKDADLTLRYVNKGFAESVGLSPEEVIGKTDYDLFSEELAEAFREEDLESMAREGPHVIRKPGVPNRDSVLGGPVVMEVQKVPITDRRGEPAGLVGIVQWPEERDLWESMVCQQASLMMASGDAVLGVSLDGELLMLNPAVEEIYGWRPEELQWQSFFELVPPDAREEAKAALERVRGGETIRSREARHLHKDGTEFPVELTISPVTTAEGNVVAASLIVRDITERKEAEAELRENEQRFREVLAHTRDVIYRVQCGPEGYDYLSPSVEQLTGFTPQQYMALGLEGERQRIHPEDREKLGAAWPMPDTRVPETEWPSTVEYRFERRDGGYVQVSNTRTPVRDEEGRLTAIVGAMRDVTPRKRAEEALRAGGERTGSMLDDISDRVFVKDRDLRYLYVNEAFARERRLQPEQMLGKSDRDLVDPEMMGPEKARQSLADDREAIESGRPVVQETTWTEPWSGLERCERWTKIPIKDERGRVTALVGVGTWTEERRRASRLLGHWSALVDSSADPIAGLAADGRILSWNPAAEQLYGYDSAEVEGRNLADLAAPEHRELVEEALRRVAEGETVDGFEVAQLSSEGRRFHVALTMSPVFGEDGEVGAVSLICRDVTARKKAESTMSQQIEGARELLGDWREHVFVKDRDLRFTYVNDAFARSQGLDPEEIIGKTDFDLFPPEEAEAYREADRQVLESGEVELDTKKISPAPDRRGGGAPLAPPLGGPFTQHIRKIPITSAEGGVEGLIGIVSWPEKRKAVEGAVCQWAALLRSSADAVMVLGPDGSVLSANPSMEGTYGYRRSELIGRRVSMLVGEEEWPRMEEASQRRQERRRRDGLPHRGTASWIRPDGKENLHEWSAVARDMGDKYLVFGVDRDITERRRMERRIRQKRKMEAIGQLAGGVAHDFNNLLTVILGGSDMLELESEPGTGVHEAAQTIRDAAQRAAELVQQLLGFAREGKYQSVTMDINAVVRDALRLVERTIPENVEVEEQLCEDSLPVVGDPAQMQQVLLNLATNARDAMPDGGRMVFRTTRKKLDWQFHAQQLDLDAGEYVVISVRDTGCGIPERLRSRVFDPFFTTKQPGEGTGMGLAMVYGIVENHGGAVDLASEEGGGTKVSIYLPEAEEDAPRPAEPERGDLMEGKGLILLVDDEDMVLRVGGAILERLGYEVLTATSGKEAVELYRQHSEEVELAIIDMVMPRMGGRECFEEMRRIDPNARAVLSTGYGMNDDTEQILQMPGMVGFVQKPYRVEELGEKIQQALAAG